ncbi:MAG: hypothetical protein GC131_02850 [Alphaproteobacteria bacterium]|nr:hypothetical protein [Alphaproteobacteria bacterium]
MAANSIDSFFSGAGKLMFGRQNWARTTRGIIVSGLAVGAVAMPVAKAYLTGKIIAGLTALSIAAPTAAALAPTILLGAALCVGAYAAWGAVSGVANVTMAVLGDNMFGRAAKAVVEHPRTTAFLVGAGLTAFGLAALLMPGFAALIPPAVTAFGLNGAMTTAVAGAGIMGLSANAMRNAGMTGPH